MAYFTLLSLLLLYHVTSVIGKLWVLEVQTGDYDGSSSTKSVTVYGLLDTVTFSDLSGTFLAGSYDWSWEFSDEDIGEPYQIHPYIQSGANPRWYLSWMRLQDGDTGKYYTFTCNCWITKYDDIYVDGVPKVCHDIENCKPEAKECGSEGASRCTDCYDPYYGGGWFGGCPECTHIDHCTDLYCSSADDQKCRTCESNTVLWKVSEDLTQCDKMCAWNNHYCWPGTCGDGLVKYCQCSDGFILTASKTETSCQLNIAPIFETCLTETEGPNLEKKTSESSGPTNECQYQRDFYGNFLPVTFRYELLAFFRVDTSVFPSPSPYYIDSYGYGVTDVEVQTVFQSVSGTEQQLSATNLLVDTTSSTVVTDTFHNEGDIMISTASLNNGDRYVAYGGGHLRSYDVYADDYQNVPYQKTMAVNTICYLYDDSAPQHCLETNACSKDPLTLSTRITQNPNIDVFFEGWFDPVPDDGNETHASSIESYQVIVNEVSGSVSLQVDTAVVFTKKVNNTESTVTLNITSDSPKLYCVTLEVKDFADNVRHARRFFLYDNSTFIATRIDKKFFVSSAEVESNYIWQKNNNEVCLDWKDHFYNDFYISNNLLGEVEPDPHGFISGVYEQNNGILSVSGTPNVHGIIKFLFSFARYNSSYSYEMDVPDFENQTFCKNLNASDGDVFRFKIRAVDIANHSLSEVRVVNIDASEPHLEDIGLVKDGYTKLYVHDQIDLSKMDLQFDAYDPHSGIKTVEWVFGILNASDVVESGAISVLKVDQATCFPPTCYCPMVGEDCELQRYSVPVNTLVSTNNHIGNHNRNYFFTIKVTNNANLYTTESLQILVDESPPETGVVLEGPEDYPDIDYTSDETFLVHWYGFIDHESGIKLYRIGLAVRCLSKSELYQMNDDLIDSSFAEVLYPENTLRLSANFTGRRYVSIIALNNAMEPSDAVCSDGISVDASPPKLHDISLDNAKWSESIYCDENTTWLLLPDLTKVKLANTEDCGRKCNLTTFWPLIDGLPTIISNTGNVITVHNGTLELNNIVNSKNINASSNILCSTFPAYESSMPIYLPNDRITLRWDVREEISQIEDIYVGIGTNPSEKDAPGIIDYIPTNKKTTFHINHAGIGTDKEFFLFLKPVNKAGLQIIIPIGPVLIDQTPPRFRSIPEVTIDNGEIIVGWENDTFYDDEQTSQISRIVFQIGHDNQTVLPVVEWRREFSDQCPPFTGGCFKYSLPLLQKQDTNVGLMFHVIMHVYNNAGHFITVTTQEFGLPSVYPPGHAIVTDIDPLDGTDSYFIAAKATDIDAHFSMNTVCVTWAGFSHHEDLMFEIGIGSLQGIDDIYNFTHANNSNVQCITSSDIPSGIKIFASLRATSTGGSTVSVSDSVIIYDSDTVMNDLVVFDGPECLNQGNIMSTSTDGSGETLVLEWPVSLGKTYTLRLLGQNIPDAYANADTLGIRVKQIINHSNHTDLIFQPFLNIQSLPLPKAVNGSNITAELYACEEDVSAIKPKGFLEAHWLGHSDQFTYETAVITLRCSNTSDEACYDYQTPFTTINGYTAFISDLLLRPESTYHVGVKPCLNGNCLSPKLSPGVYIEPNEIVINIRKSEMSSSSECTNVDLEWDHLSNLNVSFYQWSVAATIGGMNSTSMIHQWHIVNTTSETYLQVHGCVNLPLHAHRRMYACVRAFSDAGEEIQTCKACERPDLNAFNLAVYDFDASSDAWNSIMKNMHSRNLDDALRQLHNEELDFGTTDTEVVGAIPSGTDRNITWFLTTTKTVPKNCNESPECKTSRMTTDGYVQFRKADILVNTFYYICASAEESTTVKENFTEKLPSVRACSNGFVIDDTPPYGGEVHVRNVSGFLNDLREIVVHWNGFDDNINASRLGYENKINTFTVEIGSSPNGGAIKQYSGIRGTASLLVEDFTAESGTFLFVSVTATDHAGLETRATSEELVVDLTPPTVGRIVVDSLMLTRWISDDMLRVVLMDFSDEESGMDYFTIFVGSSSYSMDIVSETRYTDNLIEINLQNTDMMDGHVYHIGAKAVNRAGLSSSYITKDFGVDRSPPTGGKVMDGLSVNGKEIDFQTDVHFISGHWKGFTDPHSGIAYYRAGLGTGTQTFDIEPMIDVGLREDITWNSRFTPGEKYYITVEACNGAALCHSVSSDGLVLDDSPPTPGLVNVGSSSYHRMYMSSNSSVEIFWTGFEDPQSGMDHYVTCVGTIPGSCDVMPLTNCLLGSGHIQTGLNMPINTHLFVTVAGYNRNNKGVSKTSNYFVVDTSPPEILTTPTFVTNYTRFQAVSSQWEKSVIKLAWKFFDAESPIIRHVLTLVTHHEGHAPVENIELGQETEMTINLDDTHWLKIGDTYKAIVTACNAAGLCSSSESDDLLIDSTPPHLGGFKNQMTWQNYLNESNQILSILNLSLYGFHDQESGIKYFYIGVGKTFTDNELSNGFLKLDAKIDEVDYIESFHLNGPISSDDKVVVSVIAENNAGLMSPVARATLVALTSSHSDQYENASGIFEIEKHSCDIHFCNKDCTCAVVGKVCTEVISNLTCSSVTPTVTNPLNVSVRVYSGLSDEPQSITASSACLSAHWYVDIGISNIKRFEWTAGLKDEPYGEGIFDLSNERPWMDTGKFQYGVHCLPTNRSLKQETGYLIYVRAWVDMNTYLIFQSPPVMVDQTPPAVRKDTFVKDTDSTCANEFDHITWTQNISACWTDVFYESQGLIIYYIVGLGTEPGADNVISSRNVELNTTFAASGLSLSSGHHYYFTVTAYNNAGLHTTKSSDGFVVDLDRPIAGVVYNTDRYQNNAAQTAIDSFQLSWHGFLDHDSGIKAYYVAVVEDSENQTVVKDFTDVNMRTSLMLTNLNLTHGKRYYGAVKAIDAANYESDVIFSKSKLIDATAPSAYICNDTYVLYEMQVETSKSETMQFPASFDKGALYSITGKLDIDDQYTRIKLIVAETIRTYLPFGRSHDGTLQFHFTFYSSFEGIYNVSLEIISLAFFSAHISLSKCEYSLTKEPQNAVIVTQFSPNSFKASIKVIDPESNVKRAIVGVGSNPRGQQLKSFFPVDVSTDTVFSVLALHRTPLFVTAVIENVAGLRSVFRSKKLLVDHTAPVIENVSAEAILNTRTDANTILGETEARVQLDVSWNATDEESGMQMCFISVGSLSKLDDIQKPQLASTDNHFLTEEFNVSHGDKLFINIKCVNNVELATVKEATPIIISTRGPSSDDARLGFISLSDSGLMQDQQETESSQSNLAIYWDGFRDTSGINYYEYRILSETSSLVDWTNTGIKRFVSLYGLTLAEEQIYTAEVRAVNVGNVKSETVSATILIDSKKPQLTGNPITITTDGRRVTLDWENVFTINTNITALFDVTVGSAEGFNDIIDKRSLSTYSTSFLVPTTSVITANIHELFIYVDCVYTTGARLAYNTSYKIPFENTA